jgi:hypothetical protein
MFNKHPHIPNHYGLSIQAYKTSICIMFFPRTTQPSYILRSTPSAMSESNDEVLEYLVQKVEETGVGPSVTLMIGGLVIVGVLVRSKLYYDYLLSLFKKSEGETKGHSVILDTRDSVELETLERYFKDWKDFMTQLGDRKDKSSDSLTHIHLQNVEVWEIFSTEPFWFEYWRGKLSSIDGFSLGTRGQMETKASSGSVQLPGGTDVSHDA